MAFVKVYQYYIPKEKVEEFFRIQAKASEIYAQYIESDTVYLNSKQDETKWMELTSYKDERDYVKTIDIINEDKELKELYRQFESLLAEGQGMSEDDFIIKRGIHSWRE